MGKLLYFTALDIDYAVHMTKNACNYHENGRLLLWQVRLDCDINTSMWLTTASN